MEKIYLCIDKLISYAKTNLCLNEKNEDYVKNNIFQLFNLDSYATKHEFKKLEDINYLLNDLCNELINKNIIEEYDIEYYQDQIMGMLSLMPSEIDNIFNQILKEKGSKDATEWFYNYSIANDYVKKAKLDKNPRYERNGLIITINKAKPEFRDPKKAASGNATKGGYPKCSICHENEGFAGRMKKTLRTIDLNLDNQKWFWQFSPYGYFYQHGIAVNYCHTPMHVDFNTFYRLMDFVDQFPHYFIGSNAALPRIGGSVLAHDHYQGGKEILPMHKAKAYYTLYNDKYNDAIVEILDWPNTVIRVVSKNKKSIAEISELIREKWVNYNNVDLDIIAKDNDGIHSAISPTVIKTDRGYEMSIILRNNITNEKYPDGIFHAHPQFHIIKKESIGLIEAQGLFILPGRLESELEEIKNIIVNNNSLPDRLLDFKMVYEEIIELCNNDYSDDNVSNAIIDELASICNRILENTSVFKDKAISVKFMEDLGFICK